MEDKIKWFEEVLAMEPDSKLFFPLAKLYLENEQLDKAIEQLQAGINKYPEHFQARCLLLELMYKKGDEQNATEQMDTLLSGLRETPAFWSLWADHLEQKGYIDEAIAARFLTIKGEEENISWSDVLTEGLKAFKHKKKVEQSALSSARTKPEPSGIQTSAEQGEPAASQVQQKEVYAGADNSSEQDSWEEEELSEQPSTYRTKTMAEILAEQGDYAGALEIYKELWGATPPGQERSVLEKRIKELEAKFDSQDESGQVAGKQGKKDREKAEKNRLMNTMQALVDRLEARVEE